MEGVIDEVKDLEEKWKQKGREVKKWSMITYWM